MELEALRREVRFLRIWVVASIAFAGLALLGAAQAVRPAAFDTLTVHRIDVVDRAGKRAMTLTDHDDFPAPVINGKEVKRQSGNDENGIVFYNQLGNEQGALLWDGRRGGPNGDASATVLSYDSVDTDQLLQLDDFSQGGKHSAYLIGWNRPEGYFALVERFQAELGRAKTDVERAALRARYRPVLVQQRFFFGYDNDQVAKVLLSDAKGQPRINMFVTPAGEAKLQFLDGSGKVTYELPPDARGLSH